MSKDQELLRKVYEAFNARDLDLATSVMHPEVDWPNGWEGGRVHGRDGVREYWTRQWAAIDPSVEIVGFETDETGRIVLQVHQVVRDLEGKVLMDGVVAHVYRIEDGLVRSMDIQEASKDPGEGSGGRGGGGEERGIG
ncbi:MAG TPA: nuclear transport factor 2 family protein [Thermoanaerobaculia bacterium]|nr:nuclear transport factor 2 family protein [Thermoanaerobaculia bacterium]